MPDNNLNWDELPVPEGATLTVEEHTAYGRPSLVSVVLEWDKINHAREATLTAPDPIGKGGLTDMRISQAKSILLQELWRKLGGA